MKTNKEIGVPKNRTFKYFENELVKQEKQLSKGETRSERFSKDTQQVIHRDEKGLIAIFEEQIDQKRSFVFINIFNQKVKASVETKHLEALV